MFHCKFPCMLRLSVAPLPKMNSELSSHDPWNSLCLDCVACYQVCVTWYVLCVAWCRGAGCLVRGGPFSCASSPAELWP